MAQRRLTVHMGKCAACRHSVSGMVFADFCPMANVIHYQINPNVLVARGQSQALCHSQLQQCKPNSIRYSTGTPLDGWQPSHGCPRGQSHKQAARGISQMASVHESKGRENINKASNPYIPYLHHNHISHIKASPHHRTSCQNTTTSR